MRVVQAIAFLSGAVALNVAVAPNDRRFYWTPLVVGLAYLVAAVVAGAARPDLDIAGLYMVGAGLGAVVGLLLRRAASTRTRWVSRRRLRRAD